MSRKVEPKNTGTAETTVRTATLMVMTNRSAPPAQWLMTEVSRLLTIGDSEDRHRRAICDILDAGEDGLGQVRSLADALAATGASAWLAGTPSGGQPWWGVVVGTPTAIGSIAKQFGVRRRMFRLTDVLPLGLPDMVEHIGWYVRRTWRDVSGSEALRVVVAGRLVEKWCDFIASLNPGMRVRPSCMSCNKPAAGEGDDWDLDTCDGHTPSGEPKNSGVSKRGRTLKIVE
jgi:hypothetical protein